MPKNQQQWNEKHEFEIFCYKFITVDVLQGMNWVVSEVLTGLLNEYMQDEEFPNEMK